MAAASGDEEDNAKESIRAALVTAVALVAGVTLVVLSHLAAHSRELWTVDRLVRFDEGYESASPPLTTTGIFSVLFVIGTFVVVVAAIGVWGALARHRILVSLYVILATALAVSMLVAGLLAMQRREFVEPVIERQVLDICNASTYVRLAMNIPCPWAMAMYKHLQAPACGQFCQNRVALLRQLEGCTVLADLCKRFLYEEQSAERCNSLIAWSGNVMYAANYSSDYGIADVRSDCGRKCDADIVCQGYIAAETYQDKPPLCLLSAGMPFRHPAPAWSLEEPSQVVSYVAAGNSPSCFLRTKPYILGRFEHYGALLAWSTVLLGSALSVSTCLTCSLMYNVTVRRRRKPKGMELCLRMVWPCLGDNENSRFDFGPFSDEDEGEFGRSSREVRLESIDGSNVTPSSLSDMGSYYGQAPAPLPGGARVDPTLTAWGGHQYALAPTHATY